MLRQRRRTIPQDEYRLHPGFEKPELQGKEGYVRKDDRFPSAGYENGSHPPRELSGRQLQEMEGSTGGYELPTKGT